MIELQDFLFDIDFYRNVLSEPPEVRVELDTESHRSTIWLEDEGKPVVRVDLNAELKTVKTPAIVERYSPKMHHRIVAYGKESRTIETIATGVAKTAIERWMHYKYWSIVNG